ncbi:MAG: preprotein translocase subunit SecA, partial [Anaerolineae bacterium]|nr:preprotein translocase subunit SecA [Anaerolineae bacterium]
MFGFKNLVKSILGDSSERAISRLRPIVAQINALEPEFSRMSDDELRGQTDLFRARIAERVGRLRDELARARDEWQRESDGSRRAQLQVEVRRLERELHAAESAAMDEIMPRVVAVLREAVVRTIGQRHFDVQLS